MRDDPASPQPPPPRWRRIQRFFPCTVVMHNVLNTWGAAFNGSPPCASWGLSFKVFWRFKVSSPCLLMSLSWWNKGRVLCSSAVYFEKSSNLQRHPGDSSPLHLDSQPGALATCVPQPLPLSLSLSVPLSLSLRLCLCVSLSHFPEPFAREDTTAFTLRRGTKAGIRRPV